MPAFLLFDSASRTFALPAADVRQVLRMAAPAAVPGAPAALRGVLNVHGSLVPVIDVRARLGLPARPLHADAHLVLVRASARMVALEVDRVLEVREVADGVVESAWTAPSKLVAGTAKLSDGVVVIASVDALAELPVEAAVAP
jgi:purine-binding chemotaxis protein CheW